MPDYIQIIVLNHLNVITFGYLMFTLFDYFRHHQLKVLQITILIASILNIIALIIDTYPNLLIHYSDPKTFLDKYLGIGIRLLAGIALIIWIITLLRVSRKAYPPVFSLQKYALAFIVLSFIGMLNLIIPFQPEQFYLNKHIIDFIAPLTNLFLLEFALKLPVNDSKSNVITEASGS